MANEFKDAELLEMTENMQKHYESMIPFLTVQEKYETLLAAIEHARAARLEATIRIAQMSAHIKEEPNGEIQSDK